MSEESAASAPTRGDQITDILNTSPHPLTLAEVVKKLPRGPQKADAATSQEQARAALEELRLSGRAFSAPSGKHGETRYWSRDEALQLRESARRRAEPPVELPKLAKAVARDVKGADTAFVEELVQGMLRAAELFTHPPKGTGAERVGTAAPPPPPPPLSDRVASVLNESPLPLPMAEVVKKLGINPRKADAAYLEQVRGTLEEELRTGRAFACPSGKNEEIRYWNKDERHRVREHALTLAQTPLPLVALVKSVSKEVAGASSSFVEGVLRDMIGAETLFAHPGKSKSGVMVGTQPPPPPPPPLAQGKHPASVRKIADLCEKLAKAAGVSPEDVLAEVRKHTGGPLTAPPVAPTAEMAPPPPASPTVEDADLVRHIHDAVEREGTMSLKDLRHQMPIGGRGAAFDRAVLALEEAGKVSLSRDFDSSHFGPEEQAEYVREGEILFTSIAKRS